MGNEIVLDDNVTCRMFPVRLPPLPRASVPIFFESGAVEMQIMPRANPVEAEPNKTIPRILHFAADHSGCGWWRFNQFENVTNYSGKASVINLDIMPSPESAIFWSSGIRAVRLQRQSTPAQYNFFNAIRRTIDINQLNIRMIYEIDDIVIADKLPDFNAAKEAYTKPEIQDSIKKIIGVCDEFTVVSPYMKKLYHEFVPDAKITVLPNFASRAWFGNVYDFDYLMRNYDKNKKRPRILLSGGGTHQKAGVVNPYAENDFLGVIDDIISARKDFKFVWQGTYPTIIKPFIDNGEMEYSPWANLSVYPFAVKNLGCQVLIAPLANNDFNKAKSSIKFEEACFEGMPSVLQNLEPYKMAFNKFDTGAEMIDLLKSITKSEKSYEKQVLKAHKESERWYIDDKIDDILKIYTTPYEDKSRRQCYWYNQFN